MILALHGENDICDGYNLSKNKRSTWSRIVNTYKDFDRVNLPLNNLLTKIIGRGDNTRFWNDVWCDSCSLAEKYPRLAALDMNQNCWVSERVRKTNNGLEFRWNWRRAIREGREAAEVVEIHSLCQLAPLEDTAGKWFWSLENSGVFSVCSL